MCVTSAGTRTFYLYRRAGGRPVRIRIGRFPQTSIDQARREAARLQAEIAAGNDPQAARTQARREATWGRLFEYWLEYARRHKRTWREDQRLYGRFLKDWEGRQLSAVRCRDIEGLHGRIEEQSGPYQANRVLGLIRAAVNKANRIGYHGENPAAGVRKFREKSRDRYAQPHEIRPLFGALAEEPPLLRDFFLLLLFTGARRGNLQAMRWEDLDLDTGVWRIPDSKSGDTLLLPLIPPAMDILRERERTVDGSGWVFASKSRTGNLMEPKSAWRRVCQRAGLVDLRMHDLRRTLGSWQAALRASLPVIGKSLGHRDGSSATAIYARLALDPIRQSVEKAGAVLLEAGGSLED